jgi:tetratricopeptide (TPR) repeat protein
MAFWIAPAAAQDTSLAAAAHSSSAADALIAKDNDRAIALATKALNVTVTVDLLYIRGTAYSNDRQFSQAAADLERATAMAVGSHSNTETLNAIKTSLVAVYLFGGQPDRGLALAEQLSRESGRSAQLDRFVESYFDQRTSVPLAAGDRDGAVAALEADARKAPSWSVAAYVQAASILVGSARPDWRRVELEAQKALALDIDSPDANYIVGIAKSNQGDPAGAMPYIQRARLHAGDPKNIVEAGAALSQPAGP